MIDRGLIISGTDTDIGKTVLSALLMSALPDYSYWKPIQAGTLDESDTACVQRLSGCDALRIIPERYVFANPLSPHAAAQMEGVRVESESLLLPTQTPLLIEGAGGLLVPLNENTLFIDVFKRWELPVLLSSRAGLGTINHTLLSIEALRNRVIPLLGIVMIGDLNISNERSIEHYGDTQVLGRIPRLTSLTSATLREVYRIQFQLFDTTIIA
jgi:dethiobiotin synthetase